MQQITNYYQVHYLAIEKNIKISFEELKNIVCEKTGIKTSVIFCRTRKREIVEARQIFMKLCTDFLSSELSTTKIGIKCGGFDHCTVIHAIKNVNEINYLQVKYLQIKNYIKHEK